MAIKVNNLALFQSIPVIDSLLTSPGLSIVTMYELNLIVTKTDAAIKVLAKMRDQIISEHGTPAGEEGGAPRIDETGLQKLTELFNADTEIEISPIAIGKLDGLTALRKPDGTEEKLTAASLHPVMWMFRS